MLIKNSLRITESFSSIQGETSKIGLPTVFIRLTGCPLRCQYCDTSYAFYGGEIMLFEDIICQVTKFNCKDVCVTGGEPLAQSGSKKLLKDLVDLDFRVSLETGGSISIEGIDERVKIIMDIKTPDSGKIPETLLKSGFCYFELGNFEQAKQILNLVTSQYPNTSVARLAVQKLKIVNSTEQ